MLRSHPPSYLRSSLIHPRLIKNNELMGHSGGAIQNIVDRSNLPPMGNSVRIRDVDSVPSPGPVHLQKICCCNIRVRGIPDKDPGISESTTSFQIHRNCISGSWIKIRLSPKPPQNLLEQQRHLSPNRPKCLVDSIITPRDCCRARVWVPVQTLEHRAP